MNTAIANSYQHLLITFLHYFVMDEAKMLIYREVPIKYYPLPSLARYEKGFTAQRA
ncbi:MAG: hypothetical protein MRQ13_04045 [Candidatus Midichloria sp.]|nr:hypothetical protein [Candidatus Midichloria sp.]